MTTTHQLQGFLSRATLLLLGIAGPALAHDDATLATMKAPHGGQMKVAGPWHLELVQKSGSASEGNTLIVYVTDHSGLPVASAALTGSATILAGREKQTAALRPDGDNRLSGKARYDVAARPKVVVAVSGGGQSEQARFTPAP